MGWFGEQLQLRQKKDEALFENAFQELSSVVMPSAASKTMEEDPEASGNAIGEILRHLHVPVPEVPQEIKGLNDRLEHMLRPTGVMRRRVELTDTWYRDSINPILAARKDGTVAALLPSGIRGYSWYDPVKKKRVRVTKKNAEDFETDAFCFYGAFPQRKISMLDLIWFIVRSLSVGDYIFTALMSFVIALVGLVTPYATQVVFSSVIPAGVAVYLLPISVLLVTSLIASNLFNVCSSVFSARLDRKLSISVKSAAMARLLSLPAGFFKGYASGETARRLNSLNELASILKDTVINTGLTALFSVVYVVQIFGFSPPLAITGCVILGLNLLYTVLNSYFTMSYSRKRLLGSAKLDGMVFALFSGIQKIKLSGSEKRLFGRWAKEYKKEAKLDYDPPMLIKLGAVFSVLFTSGSLLVLYTVAALSNVTPATYMAFTTAYASVSTAIMGLASITGIIAKIKPMQEMAAPILSAVPDLAGYKKSVTSLSGGIELSNISFSYQENGPKILDNLSLKIRPNQYVAIVGKTGCGKSTLMRILLGFEKPQSGAVYYDGKDLETLDVRSVRRGIGVVMQNGSLFAGDIYSNIVVSAPWLTLEDAWEAAHMAGIDEDIRRMPMNMHTIISEGSGGISGGQKQRLMIARAIAPKPKIIMFDEATSALDNITQKQVSASLDGLKSTRIVIAHRLSTIKQCDRIILLDKGQIAEDGTFEELVEKGGAFAELVKRQMV